MESRLSARKLAAILNADVQGYSRLMADDEAATVRTLSAYREVMTALVGEHRGRVVDFTGDNLLAEFPSVVDAIQCAVDIQRDLEARNASLPEHRRMRFRIGINLGDVIVAGERIYGDGVNVAARVQALSDAGGVAISGMVHDGVGTKLPYRYESLGEHRVKNIPDPIRVYRVAMATDAGAREATARLRLPRPAMAALVLAAAVLLLAMGAWFYVRPSGPQMEIASKEKMAFPLPDKPSIAVLPFANVSADPKQEHFSDGMTEEIITTLSKVSGLFVIASNSVFTYKGKPVKVQQVSRELGVRYVLEGSVRQSAPRIRVTAQLIDATTGHHLWAERYDRELKDVFAVQDEIAQKIVTALEVKLTEGEQARVWRKTTDNVQAWELFSQGVGQYRQGTRESLTQSRLLLEKAIAVDPKFAVAYAALSSVHATEAFFLLSSFPGQSLERAFELAQRAITLDDSLADSYGALAYVYLLRRKHTEAIAAGEHAVALNPGGADVAVLLAGVLQYSGRPEESIGLVKKAMRLSPVYPPWYLGVLSRGYVLMDRYEEALATSERFRDLVADNAWPYLLMAFAYAGLDRETEARAAMAHAVRLQPNITLESMAKGTPFRNLVDLERHLDRARKAGLK